MPNCPTGNPPSAWSSYQASIGPKKCGTAPQTRYLLHVRPKRGPGTRFHQAHARARTHMCTHTAPAPSRLNHESRARACSGWWMRGMHTLYPPQVRARTADTPRAPTGSKPYTPSNAPEGTGGHEQAKGRIQIPLYGAFAKGATHVGATRQPGKVHK